MRRKKGSNLNEFINKPKLHSLQNIMTENTNERINDVLIMCLVSSTIKTQRDMYEMRNLFQL